MLSHAYVMCRLSFVLDIHAFAFNRGEEENVLGGIINECRNVF
jgi:hypothetical protein